MQCRENESRIHYLCFHVLFNLLSLWLVGTPQVSVSLFCQSCDNWGQNLLQTDRQILWHHIWGGGFFFQAKFATSLLASLIKYYFIICLSLLIWELSLRLPRDQIENWLYVTNLKFFSSYLWWQTQNHCNLWRLFHCLDSQWHSSKEFHNLTCLLSSSKSRMSPRKIN